MPPVMLLLIHGYRQHYFISPSTTYSPDSPYSAAALLLAFSVHLEKPVMAPPQILTTHLSQSKHDG